MDCFTNTDIFHPETTRAQHRIVSSNKVEYFSWKRPAVISHFFTSAQPLRRVVRTSTTIHDLFKLIGNFKAGSSSLRPQIHVFVSRTHFLKEKTNQHFFYLPAESQTFSESSMRA